MINLLPYNRRILLKSHYKRRLLVVALVTINLALLPFLVVIGVLIFMQHSTTSVLAAQYEKINESTNIQNLVLLTKKINTTNDIVNSFTTALSSSKPVSVNIEKAVSIKPVAIHIHGFEFSAQESGDVLVLSGISNDRSAIIQYGNLLSSEGLCRNVTLPVTTYTKKVDVPFTISCTLVYATN